MMDDLFQIKVFFLAGFSQKLTELQWGLGFIFIFLWKDYDMNDFH